MKVLVTGGTGFIGRHLIKHLKHQSDVTVLTRSPNKAYGILGHDIHCLTSLPSGADFDAFDAVINLAGEPIADKRWTERQKQRICDSRWQLTAQLAENIRKSQHPPILISGSAIGFYGSQGCQILDEKSPCHDATDFAHHVCQQWEELARSVNQITRVCIVRTGIVLAPEFGALKKMLPPYRLGLGGPIGDGSQYMSWIHVDDMVRIILFLLENSTVYGTFNATAPNPVSNQAFSETLARTLHRPHIFKTPALVMQLLLGEMSNLLTGGQRVIPKKIEAAGFNFHHPELGPALERLINKSSPLD
ncbi:TIGR01777 family oxidoreductase [Echinimonas agarilytica]|uniref:TIGR01777 family oxidoreductase n=1 Tax=Echinimonas agarilytica TaxID=1215918 RepID=A0AA42B7I1_9GAMM|nr:TIGR01777 family oxidoreductase [Echinimonas agarilytica]MCM2679328.1 TIGR01777 family oxidoreductase [Echinimonas agarilytica]